MQINIFFPPLSNCVSTPPASLSALKAYMISRGINNVSTRDLNIEFIHFLIDDWENICIIISKKFQKYLSTKNKPKSEKAYVNKLLYIYIPLVSRLCHQRLDNHAEILIRLLYDIVGFYFIGSLLVNQNFLFCDFRKLKKTIDSLNNEPIMTLFLNKIVNNKPTLVGFSLLCESQLPYTLLISNILRKKNHGIKIAVGGSYITEIVTQIPEFNNLYSFFDYVVVHEGETALWTIYKSITESRLVKHPNILYSSNSLYRHVLVEPINSLPAPNFQDMDLKLYFTKDLSLPIYSSKGCSWGRCMFCSLNSNSYREKYVRLFVSDLETISSQSGISHFQFVDENITPKRLQAISEAIIARSLNIRWFIQARFDSRLNYSLLKLMKKAGCYSIEFGLESGSPETLRRIKKGISLINVKKVLGYCEQLSYQVVLNCMVGFPDETIEDAEMTVSFLDSIAAKFPQLGLTCNTQIVKIYRSSRYGKSSDLNYQLHQLSTVAEWEGPTWLTNFKEKFRNHFIFTGQPLGNYVNDNRYAYKQPDVDDPNITISQWSIYVDHITYDFLRMEKTIEPKSYILIFHPTSLKPTTYMLNETLDSIVKLLTEGELRLSLLRHRFIYQYRNFDEIQVASKFNEGILRLNDIGAISIW